MLYRNMFLKYQSPEEGEHAAGGGDAGTQTQEPKMPTPEEWASFQSQFAQSQESNQSMQSKMTELLGEAKSAKQAKLDAQQEARLADARKTQSLEEFEKELNGQWGVKLGDKDSEIDRLNGLILGGNSDKAITELAGLFASPDAAKLMLSNLVKSEHGEGGVVTKFNGLDGNLVTTDLKQMAEYLKNSEAFKPFMNGINSSGAIDNNSRPASANAGGKAQEVSREDFEKISPAEKGIFLSKGGKIK